MPIFSDPLNRPPVATNEGPPPMLRITLYICLALAFAVFTLFISPRGEIAAHVIDLAQHIVLAFASILAIVILFCVPGYMERQERRTEQIADHLARLRFESHRVSGKEADALERLADDAAFRRWRSGQEK